MRTLLDDDQTAFEQILQERLVAHRTRSAYLPETLVSASQQQNPATSRGLVDHGAVIIDVSAVDVPG